MRDQPSRAHLRRRTCIPFLRKRKGWSACRAGGSEALSRKWEERVSARSSLLLSKEETISLPINKSFAKLCPGEEKKLGETCRVCYSREEREKRGRTSRSVDSKGLDRVPRTNERGGDLTTKAIFSRRRRGKKGKKGRARLIGLLGRSVLWG